jgi:FkbH-like protein
MSERHPLDHPFDAAELSRKKKPLKRALLGGGPFLDKRIAILGGSTTAEVKDLLELFLLRAGIRPAFYESEYNKYHEDVMFSAPELAEFKPDLVYVHTSNVNLGEWPDLRSEPEDVDRLFEAALNRFKAFWDRIETDLHCPVIQNNFEEPWDRPLGNLDAWDHRGRSHYVARLNAAFAAEARRRPSLYLQDLHYLASLHGLRAWHDRNHWYLYKYALAHDAIPELAYNLSRMVSAVFGGSRKCLVLDLDNTLWGGVIGDDGLQGLKLGPETAEGEVYTAIQAYAKALKERGIILTVSSKNEDAAAREGFSHPDSVLKLDDFVGFKANWSHKPVNISALATEINIGADSMVFLDDNPAERAIVRGQLPMVAVPEVGDEPSGFLDMLDRGRYFETVSLSGDDLQRSAQYALNAGLSKAETQFDNYDDFLRHLEMKAEIRGFQPLYFDRIAQLINKSNQFNVTTRRYTLNEVQAASEDPDCVTLYGRLKDRFGDYGLIAVSIGTVKGTDLDLDLWIMSCRVLKRGMEHAMMSEMARLARARGLKRLLGHYLPTPKNAMVKDLFTQLGFTVLRRDEDGRTDYVFETADFASLPGHLIAVDSGA